MSCFEKKGLLSEHSLMLHLEGISPMRNEKCQALPPTWQPCPASSKTCKAIFVAEIIGAKQVRGKKKTPVSMFLRLIYFKVNEITKEELAFSFAPFYLATHKQPAQIGSQFVLLKETGLSRKAC